MNLVTKVIHELQKSKNNYYKLLEKRTESDEHLSRLSALGEMMAATDSLVQVFSNLIINSVSAIKDHKKKWIKIRVVSENDKSILRIIDSGEGIPEDVVANMFDPFFTTKKSGEGTGYELSITKRILEEHSIEFNYELFEGQTCFKLTFKQNDLQEKHKAA